MIKFYLYFTVLLTLFVSCTKEKVTSLEPIPYGSDVIMNNQNCIDTNNQVSYSSDLVPILSSKCYSCHDATSGQYNLSDYTHFALFANSGQLVGCLTNDPNYSLMPISGMMDSCTIKLFKVWVHQGALNN